MADLDLEAWRREIAEYDAAHPDGPPWPDDEQPCTLDLAQLRAIIAALERAQRLEARAKALVRARALANPEWRTTAVDRLAAALEGRDG